MNSQADSLPITCNPQESTAGEQNTQGSGAGSTSTSTATSPSQADKTSNDGPTTVSDTHALTNTEDPVGGTGEGGAVATHELKEEPEIGPQPAVQHIKEEGEVSLEHVNGQIALLEQQTPGAYMGAGDGSGMVPDDGQEWVADGEHELKRVYELVGARWVDQGTAFCFGQFSDETNEALLIARSERNYNEIILSTTIRSNDVYQRQQDTLIVWTEPDGVDYALSFQDPDGCSEVWQFITEVQRHMNNTAADTMSNISSSPQIGPDTSVTTASILRSGHLPQPQCGIITEIERAIKTLARTAMMKERICEYIQHEDYIKSLIEVMHTAEDLESLENLHALCSLMQTILMLNDHSMYEYIMEDDIFFGVVGMLEYDPDFPDHKANYREFLHEQSHFHQPIPIGDNAIERKIHNAYRLQFLKDVVLARAIDDSTFNVINSCILFNQIDIISHVQHDPTFLRQLISLFVDEAIFFPNKKPPQQQQSTQVPQQGHLPPNQIIISLNGGVDERDDDMDVDPKSEDPTSASNSPSKTSPPCPEADNKLREYYQHHYSFAPRHDLSEDDINLRREVIILLQQLCVLGKNVQLPARLALFRNLVDRGIVFAVQWAISLSDKEESSKSMISAGGEVLSTLLDHDLNGVRSHVNKHVDAIERERGAKKKYADKAETLLDAMCRIMATTKDLAIQSQIGDALKTWLEVPPGGDIGAAAPAGDNSATPNVPVTPTPPANPPKPPVRKEGDTERFLDYFYKNCVGVLFKPLMELPEWKNVKEPILPLYREEANRYTYLADLFHAFIAQHGFRSHLYSISSNILGRIVSLLKAKDKHLRHSAFRIFRFLLKQNNPVSTNMMCKLDVFKPILELTLQESRRDNLLSCSCQEFFDSMRRENIKELIRFCMTNHEDLIRKLTRTPLGGQRFELFIKRYEINCQPPPPVSPKADRTIDPRAWAGPSRIIDTHEEDYFNADDNDEESGAVIINTNNLSPWPRGVQSHSPIPRISSSGKQRRKKYARLQTPPTVHRQPALGSLLDYDDEDEETPSKDAPEASTSKLPLNTSADTSPAANLSQPPEEDEEDRLLESLVSPISASTTSSNMTPTTPPTSSTSTSPRSQLTPLASIGLSIPLRLGEKRRRDEEEEEEDGLERLRKTKKTTPETGTLPKGPANNVPPPITKNKGDTKTGDDPPNRLWRVKVGSASWMNKLNPQKPPITSQPSAKDGDTG